MASCCLMESTHKSLGDGSPWHPVGALHLHILELRVPHKHSSGGWCTPGPGGKAQVPALAGTSLSQALAAACASVASLCIRSRAVLQGLSRAWAALWGCLMDSGPSSAAPHGNVPWIGLPGWGFSSWGSLCEGGWVFTACEQRLRHSPRTVLVPPWLWGVFQTRPQQMSLWAAASPSPSLARADFQVSCWVWLSCGYIPLPRSCFLVPKPEVIEQWCHFYCASGAFRQLQSQPKAAVRGRRAGPGLSDLDARGSATWFVISQSG